jgi:prepilin-type N-terminal cleavage/methylation domain-containing protein
MRLRFTKRTSAVTNSNSSRRSRAVSHMRGYSIIELLVVLGIFGILSGIAVPSLTRTYRNYQMDDAASQVAGIVKFTRYEAIRRNINMTSRNTQAVALGPASVWTDEATDTTIQPTDKQIALTTTATLVPAASAPNAAGLATKVGVAALTAISPSNGNVSFDSRGATTSLNVVNVYYVGNAAYGYRAVVVMPNGSVQVWSYATGTWTLL